MSDHVRLSHYDPAWRQEFQQTRSSLLHSCLGWVTAVEHIGSTAISGLIARPTIDVIAHIGSQQDDVAIENAALLIEGLNFRRQQLSSWIPADSLAVELVKPRHATTEPTHHVLLVASDSPLWNRTLRIRDWLRKYPEVAIRFEEAKVARWKSGHGDPSHYQTDKALFFSHLEDQIDAALKHPDP
jgi:GrpB-like predicted nucleotidyltransferase (UPF0157 family)